jgi:hypothetical protein
MLEDRILHKCALSTSLCPKENTPAVSLHYKEQLDNAMFL